MKVKSILLVTIACIHFFGSSGFAESRPDCISAASDADGDGFGWENNATCLVVAESGQCENRGGYPWGWNPVALASCRLDEPVVACTDTDGDGYGWNGIATCRIEQIESSECIDADGDGYGWNGTDTCFVEVKPFSVSTADSRWRVCGLRDSDEIEIGRTWGLTQINGTSFRPCVRRCFSDTTVDLENYAGWGYDYQSNAQCALIDELDSSKTTYSIPVYVPDETPQRLEFENEFAYPLYEGDGTWKCDQETRDGVDQLFETTGYTNHYQFLINGQLRIWNANNRSTESTNYKGWYYDGDAYYDGDKGTRSIVLIDHDKVNGNFETTGYIKLAGSSLTIYQTAFDRKACARTTPIAETNLPETVEEIENLPIIALDALLGVSMQCSPFESLNINYAYLSSSDWGYYTEPFNSGSTDVTVQFFATDDRGEARYQLWEPSGDGPLNYSNTYTVTGNLFSSFYVAPGNVARGYSYTDVVFKKHSSYVIRKDTYKFGSSGNSGATVTYSKCI